MAFDICILGPKTFPVFPLRQLIGKNRAIIMIHILMAFALKGKVLKVVIEKVIRRLLRNAKSHVMN